jgi:hypothetical protein
MSRSLVATAPHRVDEAPGKDLTTRGCSSRIASTSAAWVWCLERTVGGAVMTWEAPQFVEVKMDAEINSYQDDFGGEQDDRF